MKQSFAFCNVLILGTILLCPGCSRKESEPSSTAARRDGGPNLLLITLDTTRADRIGAYGHELAVTPTMDRLAKEGVLLEEAYAQVPLTLPSHATILTGRYPREHGIRNNSTEVLADDQLTMAEVFKSHGYRTAAFVASFVLDSRFGLGQGFDVYSDDMGDHHRDSDPHHWEQPANVVTDRALAWLKESAREPFFCWVHYYDPHHPYNPPTEFADKGMGPYDGEIAFVDSQMARLTDWLSSSGLAGQTMVIVVGDHGEALGEHGETTHGVFLSQGVMRIPWIFHFPGKIPGGRRINDIVETTDLFPTVLAYWGWDVPESLMGRSLAGVLKGTSSSLPDVPAYGESHYVSYAYGWAEQRSLLTPRWKYISSTKPQLFDRQDGPLETRNVIDEHPDVAAGLREALMAR